MKTFNEWLQDQDPELYEGLFDNIKQYGKHAAIAGSLLGAGMIGNQLSSAPQASVSRGVQADKISAPSVRGQLPKGKYTREMGGNYVNNRTGVEFDKHQNPAGGTYSKDGNSWTSPNANTFFK